MLTFRPEKIKLKLRPKNLRPKISVFLCNLFLINRTTNQTINQKRYDIYYFKPLTL